MSSINLSFFVVFHRNLSDRSHSVDAELLKSASTSTDKIEIEEDCAVDFFPLRDAFFTLNAGCRKSKVNLRINLGIHQVDPEKSYIHQLHQVESTP